MRKNCAYANTTHNHILSSFRSDSTLWVPVCMEILDPAAIGNPTIQRV